MRYIKLFSNEPEVFALCLGTVLFGTTISQKEAFRQMDLFFERGGNCIDTARVYADWLPDGHGASEKTLGEWIKERKCRDKVFISTKGAHPDLKTMNIARMSHEELRSDLEESLKVLGTDYIDVYFLHRDDVSKPVEEILTILEEFKKEGKIKHYGCSNWKLPRMMEAEKAAARLGCSGFDCNQIRFGLADLNVEKIGDKTLVLMDREILSWHEKQKKPVMAYTSSCNGFFSKKLRGQSLSPSVEALYTNEANRILLQKLALWEKEYHCSAAALVLAYVMAQDFPSLPISAFSTCEQLEESIHAADIEFPREIMEEIQSIKKYLV